MSEGEVISELGTTTFEAEPPEHPDRTIKCVDCNENFIWTSGEQAFFHDKGLKNEPKRCKPCKQAKNERLAAITAAQTSGVRQRIEVSVQCAQCGQQTTVPFYPSQGRPVYCRSCFLAGRTTPTNSSASA
jgi:CxxC-x17-CxxC domain-containing protein